MAPAVGLFFLSGMPPAFAQFVNSDATINGFLGSQNTRDFFKEGRIKLEKEIERMDDLSLLSLEELLRVSPDASIQEQEMQELESMEQPERKRDR
jgi:hypothetical protein